MLVASLIAVLHTFSAAEKLDYLGRLSSSDARAIEGLIDHCLTQRWPKTPSEWFDVAERISPKH